MSEQKKSRKSRPIADFDDRFFGISLLWMDRALIALIPGFVMLILINTLQRFDEANAFVLMRSVHNHLGRFSLFVALIMFGIAAYIGLVKHADVTPYFKRGTYVIFATMLMQALMGFYLYFAYEARPGDEVHMIYGIGTVLALPFFIYVESTSPKRPAMGSYLWGFALLAGIIIRCLGTGSV
ncbi:MAG: hypothetical protein ACPG7F_01070 [Aggregatilineales bacterium]